MTILQVPVAGKKMPATEVAGLREENKLLVAGAGFEPATSGV